MKKTCTMTAGDHCDSHERQTILTFLKYPTNRAIRCLPNISCPFLVHFAVKSWHSFILPRKASQHDVVNRETALYEQYTNLPTRGPWLFKTRFQSYFQTHSLLFSFNPTILVVRSNSSKLLSPHNQTRIQNISFLSHSYEIKALHLLQIPPQEIFQHSHM